MSEIWQIYTDSIHASLKPLYANWLPNETIALGDIGTMDGNRFTRIDNLERAFGINVKSRKEPSLVTTLSYRSADAVHVKGNPSAAGQVGVAHAKASVEISFSRKNAVFLQAEGCVIEVVESELALGKEVLKLLAAGQWNPEWHVVSRVVRAGATTVIVSKEGGASITLEVEAQVPNVDLVGANGKLSVLSENNIGFKAVAEKALSPLIGLSKVKTRWFGPPAYGSKALAAGENGPPTVAEILESLGGKSIDSVFSFNRTGDDEAPAVDPALS